VSSAPLVPVDTDPIDAEDGEAIGDVDELRVVDDEGRLTNVSSAPLVPVDTDPTDTEDGDGPDFGEFPRTNDDVAGGLVPKVERGDTAVVVFKDAISVTESLGEPDDDVEEVDLIGSDNRPVEIFEIFEIGEVVGDVFVTLVGS
jgi:hypothetical protein